MGHLQSKIAQSFSPSTCNTFLKSRKLGEQLKDKNHKVGHYIKETISTMIPAAIGSQEYSSRRARKVVLMRDALRPLMTDAFVGSLIQIPVEALLIVKACMLKQHKISKGRDKTNDRRVTPQY
jgi:hypothetical protein